MRFVSIDIETTGLNPENCQILEIGAVIEDTNEIKEFNEIPKFSCIVEYPTYSGRPFALTMNERILRILAQLEKVEPSQRNEIRRENNIMTESLVPNAFSVWLDYNGFKSGSSKPTQITVAGKNFGTFDKLFLERIPNWNKFIRINQRIIDPTVMCTDWKSDEKLPNLDLCMQRFNIEGQVTHMAVQDAYDVVRVIRAATKNYSLILF